MRTITGGQPDARARIPALMNRLISTAARKIRLAAVALKHRHQLAELAESEDHRLADMGISREDLEVALSEPLWRDPTAALARRTGNPRTRQRLAWSIAGAASAVLMMSLSAAPADAAEVRLLSAAAMQSVFKEIVPDFERTSGHKLIISYATIGGVAQRMEAGEAADVVIGSTLIMPGLIKAGRIDPATQVTVCATGIGLVVPSGTPVPRMASVEDFTRAALDAKVVIHADPVRGGAAGVHIARLFGKLGIAGRLKSQITLAAGGDVTEVTLAQGSGALGMTQISEIVGKPGAEYVGPLPDELQNNTVFVAAIPAGAQSSDAARAFISFLQSPIALAAIKAKGMRAE